MTRRNSKRHLQFESLESMELLSGAGTALSHSLIHHAQVHRALGGATPGVALNLSGSMQGTYRVMNGGSAARFAGRGNLTQVGNARLQGMIALNVNASGNSGQLTLNLGKRGKVFVNVLGSTTGGTLQYQISGGTRSFAGDSGTGLAIVSLAPSNGTRGHFTLTLQNTPSA